MSSECNLDIGCEDVTEDHGAIMHQRYGDVYENNHGVDIKYMQTHK